MGKIFKVQPSEFVDHITDDGAELTKLPYPFFVDEKGLVGRQDFWDGNPYRVIGFQRDLAKQWVDLSWKEAVEDPHLAVGKYLVTSDKDGNWSTHTFAVSSVEVVGEE